MQERKQFEAWRNGIQSHFYPFVGLLLFLFYIFDSLWMKCMLTA